MTVCACLIVKNEDHVIERCLRSIMPFVDQIVVTDTGSTDETMATCLRVLKDFHGGWWINRDEWVNFAHNRNEVLKFARNVTHPADYILTIDADEVFDPGITPVFPPDKQDVYLVEAEYGDTIYRRASLFRNDARFQYVQPIHEYLQAPEGASIVKWDGFGIKVYHDGARAKDPETYQKDRQLLLDYLGEHPDDARATFYLAQTCRDAGIKHEAVSWYIQRVWLASGYQEEVFYSLYQLGKLTDNITYYLRAFEANPKRAEPLFWYGKYLASKELWAMARILFEYITMMRIPEGLFVEVPPYTYLARLELGVALYWLGEYKLSQIAARQIMLDMRVPDAIRKQARANYDFASSKV